jgi:hypothetical protein
MEITLPQRALDGLVEAGNRNGITAEAIATELLTSQGNQYADLFRVGVVTSAAFIDRLTIAEFGAIKAAAAVNEAVAGLIRALTDSPNVSLDDPRLAPGLALLASAGLIAPERVPELLAYERPQPQQSAPQGPD